MVNIVMVETLLSEAFTEQHRGSLVAAKAGITETFLMMNCRAIFVDSERMIELTSFLSSEDQIIALVRVVVPNSMDPNSLANTIQAKIAEYKVYLQIMEKFTFTEEGSIKVQVIAVPQASFGI